MYTVHCMYAGGCNTCTGVLCADSLSSPAVKDFLEPVELEDFSEFVDHMHQNRKKGFERAFLSLPSSKLQSSAVAERMSKKNRFQNIHPCEYCCSVSGTGSSHVHVLYL